MGIGRNYGEAIKLKPSLERGLHTAPCCYLTMWPILSVFLISQHRPEIWLCVINFYILKYWRTIPIFNPLWAKEIMTMGQIWPVGLCWLYSTWALVGSGLDSAVLLAWPFHTHPHGRQWELDVSNCGCRFARVGSRHLPTETCSMGTTQEKKGGCQGVKGKEIWLTFHCL